MDYHYIHSLEELKQYIDNKYQDCANKISFVVASSENIQTGFQKVIKKAHQEKNIEFLIFNQELLNQIGLSTPVEFQDINPLEFETYINK